MVYTRKITHMKDDVGIAIIERTKAVLRPFHNSELFDPPDLSPWSFACSLPCRLLVTCVFSDLFLQLLPSKLLFVGNEKLIYHVHLNPTARCWSPRCCTLSDASTEVLRPWLTVQLRSGSPGTSTALRASGHCSESLSSDSDALIGPWLHRCLRVASAVCL